MIMGFFFLQIVNRFIFFSSIEVLSFVIILTFDYFSYCDGNIVKNKHFTQFLNVCFLNFFFFRLVGLLHIHPISLVRSTDEA